MASNGLWAANCHGQCEILGPFPVVQSTHLSYPGRRTLGLPAAYRAVILRGGILLWLIMCRAALRYLSSA
jgi:hypothetical protein